MKPFGKGKLRKAVPAQIQFFQLRKLLQKIRISVQDYLIPVNHGNSCVVVHPHIFIQIHIIHMQNFQCGVLPNGIKLKLALHIADIQFFQLRHPEEPRYIIIGLCAVQIQPLQHLKTFYCPYIYCGSRIGSTGEFL